MGAVAPVDDDHEGFREWSRVIAARYVPHDEVDAYADATVWLPTASGDVPAPGGGVGFVVRAC